MKEPLQFPLSRPQPPAIPEHVTGEARVIWPDVVHALLDAGVELYAVDYIVLGNFCIALALLRQCRQEAAGASDPNVVAALRTVESETLGRVCACAESLLLPPGALGAFLK
jgi:phage terminase small subunit